MADDNSGLMAEFEEFLNAKAQKQAESDASEDYDVEVWDEKGRGARVRRSHAKPFLQSMGIDLDPESDGDDSDNDGSGKGGSTSKGNQRPTGKQSASNASGGVARKYFVSKPKSGK
jgi:hypothetical protein